MSLLQVRPLGCRDNLVGFELARAPDPRAPQPADVRELFTLWDPHGRPHKAYPEIPIEHPTTGRELMQAQEAQWRAHVARTRRLFGAAPLAGYSAAPQRGLLAFAVEILSDRGRWTLAHRDGPRWYFTPAQLRQGLARPVPPASG